MSRRFDSKRILLTQKKNHFKVRTPSFKPVFERKKINKNIYMKIVEPKSNRNIYTYWFFNELQLSGQMQIIFEIGFSTTKSNVNGLKVATKIWKKKVKS